MALDSAMVAISFASLNLHHMYSLGTTALGNSLNGKSAKAAIADANMSQRGCYSEKQEEHAEGDSDSPPSLTLRRKHLSRHPLLVRLATPYIETVQVIIPQGPK